MDVKEEKASKYHCGPPWFFKGSALYQLHLVKADTARAFIPKELRLVEAFGYTLGDFFLAQYEDCLAGKFDELVVIAGIFWNPPTSCAWAARVLVSSDEACCLGRKEIGLPSHIATFSKKIGPVTKKSYNKSQSSLNRIAVNSTFGNPMEHSEVQVSESKNSSEIPLCNISLPISAIKSENSDKGMPKIRMSLPSFSGQTRDCPRLLKYSCEIECRISAVKPAKVYSTVVDNEHQKSFGKKAHVNFDILSDEEAQKRSILVLLSKPILALKFSFVKMWVGAPKNVVPNSGKNEVRFSSTWWS